MCSTTWSKRVDDPRWIKGFLLTLIDANKLWLTQNIYSDLAACIVAIGSFHALYTANTLVGCLGILFGSSEVHSVCAWIFFLSIPTKIFFGECMVYPLR